MALFASLICSSKRCSMNRARLAMTVSRPFRCGPRGRATRGRHRQTDGGTVEPSVLNQKFLSTLGLDGDRTMTKPFDGGQDVVGGFGPAKGLGIGVAGVDVGGDSGLQRGSRAVGAALDLLVGEQREEALDLVDP